MTKIHGMSLASKAETLKTLSFLLANLDRYHRWHTRSIRAAQHGLLIMHGLEDWWWRRRRLPALIEEDSGAKQSQCSDDSHDGSGDCACIQ
mmetsp:Transcript_20022/g.43258  ORF Transcript_20022/g.43258 Transcript_20022/m.43258 type:complete len:91 (-) Transcript_20022:304-576(-)